MTLPRILTAILLVPFMLLVVWYGTLPFFFFVLAIAMLGVWEYSVMATQGGYPNQIEMGLIGSLLVTVAIFLDGIPVWGPLHKAPSVLAVFFGWVLLVFFREFFRSDKSLSFLRIITTITGVVVSALLMGHLLLIRDLKVSSGDGFRPIGREVMFFLLFVVWMVDTGAWCVGKLIGRFPMAPVISPKKTWVGSIGGTLIACLTGWFFREAFLKQELTVKEAVLFSFFVAVVAQISDLSESLMKRSFGAKNSSELLPGHGGILDRFDSFIFAAPFFYYLLIATGRYQ